jgi:hypothetical protein
MGYADWMKSFEGNIQVDHNENMKKSDTTYESILDKYGLN